MSKTKIILAITGTLVLVGGLAAGVLLIQKNQELRTQASPATSLFITPNSQNKTPGQTFTQNVVINTGTNLVSGVQFEIEFNPQTVEIVSIQKGGGINSLDQEIKNEINNTSGRISYTAFTLSPSNWVNGQGLSALTITAKVKDSATNGLYQTTFAGTTAVSASGEGQNVVTGTTPGGITVTNSGSSPTATATATATPSPTTSPTPTLSPANPQPTTPKASAIATAVPIPVTGTSWPTYLGAGVGILIILASLALAL